MSDLAFQMIWRGEGAVHLRWEAASRCTQPRGNGDPCTSADTRQPSWDCTLCGGLGVVFAAPVDVVGLYRSRSAWTQKRMSGEHVMGEAELTTPSVAIAGISPAWCPGWSDDRVRDRLTAVAAFGDVAPGTVFCPSTRAVPFIFNNVQEGWRVQLQAVDNELTRVRPQP